jgi:hypothetical protein
LRIFDVLPCQSSLIPSDVRELIINHNDAYEFTTCTVSFLLFEKY